MNETADHSLQGVADGDRRKASPPGWRSLVLKLAIGVMALDLAAVALQILPGALADALLIGVFTLAVAGVGWLVASHMMLRALEDHHLEQLETVPPEFSHAATPPPQVGPPPAADDDWTRLVEDCVELVEELDRAQGSFEPARRELVDHVLMRLGEILTQPGVEVIRGEQTFLRDRHQADRRARAGDAIAETLSPGFAIGRRVLRRARVRLEPLREADDA